MGLGQTKTILLYHRERRPLVSRPNSSDFRISFSIDTGKNKLTAFGGTSLRQPLAPLEIFRSL